MAYKKLKNTNGTNMKTTKGGKWVYYEMTDRLKKKGIPKRYHNIFAHRGKQKTSYDR